MSLVTAFGIAALTFMMLMYALEASDDRIYAVAAWREAPYFSPAERAALALTEAATRLSDRSDPVSDEVWAEAASHFAERELAALALAIASINAWNRLNVTTAQPSGQSW